MPARKLASAPATSEGGGSSKRRFFCRRAVGLGMHLRSAAHLVSGAHLFVTRPAGITPSVGNQSCGSHDPRDRFYQQAPE
jgi:hypothetical protein